MGRETMNLEGAYSKELCEIGVHKIPDEGTRSSPMNKNPPPRPLKQWPTTFCVKPKACNCDTMLPLPLPRPKTPAVDGGGCDPENFWLYPHLQTGGTEHDGKQALISKLGLHISIFHIKIKPCKRLIDLQFNIKSKK